MSLKYHLVYQAMHPVFHASKLKKYALDVSHGLWHEELGVRYNLSYKEVQILDQSMRTFHRKEVHLVKVL